MNTYKLLNFVILLVPPPTTPASNAIATLAPEDKKTVSLVSTTGSFVLIGFVTATLLIFAIGRIFNHGRFIHMNIEIALLLAHLCLLMDFDPETQEVNLLHLDLLF